MPLIFEDNAASCRFLQVSKLQNKIIHEINFHNITAVFSLFALHTLCRLLRVNPCGTVSAQLINSYPWTANENFKVSTSKNNNLNEKLEV